MEGGEGWNLDKEGAVDAFVLLLPGQPALTQEHVHLLCVRVRHLHLVQVPVRPHVGVVVANADLKHLAQVHRLDCELVHLESQNQHSLSHHIIVWVSLRYSRAHNVSDKTVRTCPRSNLLLLPSDLLSLRSPVSPRSP